MGVDTSQLKRLHKKLSALNSDIREDFFKKEVNKLTMMTIDEARPLTPYNPKKKSPDHLRDLYFPIPAVRMENTYSGAISNQQYYAPYVEFGHRKTISGGEGTTARVTVGWVEGKHMVEKAAVKVSEKMTEQLEKDFDAYMINLLDGE